MNTQPARCAFEGELVRANQLHFEHVVKIISLGKAFKAYSAGEIIYASQSNNSSLRPG